MKQPPGDTAGAFPVFFEKLTGRHRPHDWQAELAAPAECANRLVRIPTGFGKTLGVLAAWLWRRVRHQDVRWPRRLVWCLPMRVLVEQTESEVRAALTRLGMLWEAPGVHEGRVGVHLLMGGAGAGEWHLHPEADAVLVGTQDMLLSRTMNRGYACGRARWPMEFGLLNQDALWVMDEVQLMDVGLATSGQLQVFRDAEHQAERMIRPCSTWWMSATLQRRWLEQSPDTTELVQGLKEATHRIAPSDRVGHLWEDVEKPVQVVAFEDHKDIATHVAAHHARLGYGVSGPTLVILNTVDRAVTVWKTLSRDKTLSSVDIRLIHSRFRAHERGAWRNEFLNRDACKPGTNRIIVSTQVVEAGVDLSASLLITELAPWASLVQRFGRCARWGGRSDVVIADLGHENDKQAAPYTLDELTAALAACQRLPDVAPCHLERFEDEHEELLTGLYPYDPKHLLLRHELDELFDTTADLSGADVDVSRFIRSGDERDVQVFWAQVDTGATPPDDLKPARSELCSVPFLKARDWLCERKSNDLKPGVRAWVWDWLNRHWRDVKRRDIYPGQTLLVESRTGGYRPDLGWDPTAKDPVNPLSAEDSIHHGSRDCWRRDGDGWRPHRRRVHLLAREDHADDAEDGESLSILERWQTIASHGLQVGQLVKSIADQVAPQQARLLHLAGRWHDLGKAHPAFQCSIQADDRPPREDIAKAPDIAWPCSVRNMYRISSTDQRRGFRHELASTLGLFAVLQRHEPDHAALIGPWSQLFDAMQEDPAPVATLRVEPTPIEREILDLTAEEFDLLAYLVCAHHGKVRMAWHSSPADQQSDDARLRIRGIIEGDTLPSLHLADAGGGFLQFPATALDLSPSAAGLSPRTGRSWTERILALLDRFGPFTLAWLETVLRAADQRASNQPVADHLLEKDHADQHVAGSRRTLAQPVGGGTQTPSHRRDSGPRRPLDGDGERAGGRGLDSPTTRPPHAATRYIDTALGILSYRELAPHLAERVANADLAIVNRSFADLPIHDLLLDLHRRICADLTPEMAGRWRRHDVRVGEHQPPRYWHVPVLMRMFADDLDARLAATGTNLSERLIEDLTFAEGRLLHIHPFEDFNGRVTRLFLVELMNRLDLPVIDPSAPTGEATRQYFAALRAYDRGNPRPLAAIWHRRFEQEPQR